MQPVTKAITTRDGVKLFSQVFERGSKYWLIATHGIGEHSDRHEYLKDLFGQDINIFLYDIRGHGRSEGEKAYISNFSKFHDDLEDCIKYIKNKYEAHDYILFGHSMGALITCGFAKKRINEEFQPRAIIVNAPPVGVAGPLGKIVASVSSGIIGKLSSFKASIALGGLVDIKHLSHKQEVLDDYLSDKYVHTKLHTKLLLEMMNSSRDIFSSSLNTDIPFYCSYGTADGIVDTTAIESFFKENDPEVILTPIEGAYHEIHNELDKYKLPYFEYLKETVRSILFS